MSEPFVARERELDRLGHLLDEALAGHGQVAFVTGEAGAGKTSLLREFTRRAQQTHAAIVAASGECNDLASQADPYLPFREVLAQLAGDVDKPLAQGSITPDGADRLKRLLARSGQVLVDIAPDLINVVIPGTRLVALLGKAVASRAGWLERLDGLARRKHAPATIGAPSLSSDRIYEEYSAFLRRLSESQPLLILLDDLQWTDSASAGLLFHLSRRIADRPILILGAYRPDVVAQGRDGSRHPLEPVLNEVKRYSGQGAIDMAPSTEEARAFVDAVLDAEPNALDDAFREALCRRTEGLPIFLAEVLRAMRERGDLFQDDQGRWAARPGVDWSSLPERVEAVIAERIGRLPPDDLPLLETASVEGSSFIGEVVARVVDRDPRQVISLLSTSLDRGHALVSGAGVRRIGEQRLSSYTFRHKLIQEYVYQSLDAAPRAYLHEDVAKALIALYGEDDNEILGQLAWHFDRAGVAERAFHYAVLAGDRAAAAYANADALVNYSAAVELLREFQAPTEDVIHLYRSRGRAFELSGDPESALANYQAMRALGLEKQSAAIEVAALAAQATLLAIPTGKHNVAEARRLATEALEMARATANAEAEAQVLWSLLLIDMFSGQYAEAVRYGEQSETLARQLGLREQLAFTLNDLDHAYGMAGEQKKALAAGAEARRLWEELGNQPMLANSTSREAVWYFFAGDLDRAKETAGKAVRIGRSIGNHSALSLGQTVVGLISFEQGDGRAAEETLQEAVESGRRANNTLAMTGVLAELSWLMACAGRPEEALAAAQEAFEEADRRYRPAREWTAAILVRLHLLRADVPAAEAAFARAEMDGVEDRLDQTPIFGGSAIGLAVMELAQARGDLEGSLVAADRLIEHLNRIGARLYLQDVQLLRGKALLALDRRTEARSALEMARQVAKATGSRRILWMILDAQADLEQAAGDSSAAHELRRQARQEVLSIAEGLGDETLRADFLASPRVAALLAKEP